MCQQGRRCRRREMWFQVCGWVTEIGLRPRGSKQLCLDAPRTQLLSLLQGSLQLPRTEVFVGLTGVFDLWAQIANIVRELDPTLQGACLCHSETCWRIWTCLFAPPRSLLQLQDAYGLFTESNSEDAMLAGLEFMCDGPRLDILIELRLARGVDTQVRHMARVIFEQSLTNTVQVPEVVHADAAVDADALDADSEILFRQPHPKRQRLASRQRRLTF